MIRFSLIDLKDQKGSVAIIFAITLSVLALGVGGAIDFGRWSTARSKTSVALDAAVLAGARTLLITGDESQAVAAAQSYYNKNIATRLDVVNDTVNFAVVDEGTAFSGTGNANLATTFLQIMGITQLPLVLDPAASFPKAKIKGGAGSNIEVAVMMDITGSMCDDGEGPCTTGTKLDALKTAAKDLVNIVVQDQQSPYTSRVALVPFAKRIRVAPDGMGGSIMKTLTDLDPTWSGWHEVCVADGETSGNAGTEAGVSTSCATYDSVYKTDLKIRPCVTDRFYDNPWGIDGTDDAPGIGRWLNAYNGRRETVSLDSSNTPPTEHLGLTQEDPADHYNWNENGDCSADEANEILPLSSDKMQLKSRIDGLEADSVTAGALGTAFTWYMLSPKWASIWPTTAIPGSYADLTSLQASGQPMLRKVAVLMSDGVFNSYRGWKDKDQQTVSDFAKQLCTNMKAQGIEIYTVGFQLDQLPAAERTIAEDTLRSCGTDIQHFYNTINPEELQGAFRDIAVQLTAVTLVR